MPRDAVHGTAVHKTKDMGTINRKRSQHRNKSFKAHADTKMFPIIKAFTENTELLDLAVKERQRLSRLQDGYEKICFPSISRAYALMLVVFS